MSCCVGASAAALDELAVGGMDRAQLKLTYLGPQDRPIPTIVVTISGRDVDWPAFAPWRSAEHGNDRLFEEYQGHKPSFSVSPEEMRTAMLGLSRVHREMSTAEAAPFLSCTVTLGESGAVQRTEVRLNDRAAKEWFVLLRGAFRADPKDIQLIEGSANLNAMQTLQSWGCGLGLLPSDIPARDVTAQTRVAVGGMRRNATLQRFENTVTLTNTSNQAIKAPIALVVVPAVLNISLVNAQGTTCVTRPSGLSFINLSMAAAALEPGESVEQILVFGHGEGEPIRFTTKVLAGPGER